MNHNDCYYEKVHTTALHLTSERASHYSQRQHQRKWESLRDNPNIICMSLSLTETSMLKLGSFILFKERGDLIVSRHQGCLAGVKGKQTVSTDKRTYMMGYKEYSFHLTVCVAWLVNLTSTSLWIKYIVTLQRIDGYNISEIGCSYELHWI